MTILQQTLDTIFNEIKGKETDSSKVKDDIAYQVYCFYKGIEPKPLYDTGVSDIIKSVIEQKLAGTSYNTFSDTIDVFGFIFEYTLSCYEGATTKQGEFFSPPAIQSIVSDILGTVDEVYDPTIGSGSLISKVKASKVYGQEKSPITQKFAQYNLDLMGYQQEIVQGNTLDNDGFVGKQFGAIVSNHPYSVAWDKKGLKDDPRFKDYATPPASKCDYAFILHCLSHLKKDGIYIAVVPHGLLFRGNSEGRIREQLIEEKKLNAVIGLPAKLFMNVDIPVALMIFKEESDKVMFIDASKDFIKNGTRNDMDKKAIAKLVQTYKEQKEIDKYSRTIDLDEIRDNDYNLNIPRYIDTFEEEEPVDLKLVNSQLEKLDEEIEEIDKDIQKFMKELGQC